MNLCLNSLGCPDWDAERLLSTAGSLGIQALEIRGLNGKLAFSEIEEFSENGSIRFREELKKRGICLAGLGSSAAFHSEAILAASLNEAKETVLCAIRTGANFVRVFGNDIPKDENETVVLDRVSNALRELCEFSRSKSENERPIDILLEAHGDFNTAKRLGYVCENVGCDNFGIIWDVAHVDRAIGDDIEPFYFELKPYIRHFHIKDHKRTKNGYVLCPIGSGDIPISRIAELALTNGFNGYFSLESEKKWHPELPEPDEEFPRFAEYMRSLQ